MIFKFVTDRVQQEWKLDIYENGKGEKQAILATDRKPDRVSQTDAYVKDLNMRKIIDLHSHNDKDGTKGGSSHDMKNSKSGIKNAVYHTHEKKIYEYNRKQKNTNEKHIGTNYKLLYDYITQKIDLH